MLLGGVPPWGAALRRIVIARAGLVGVTAIGTFGYMLIADLTFVDALYQTVFTVATVGYTELFSLITWTSAGLTGAVATVAGQSLGSGNAARAQRSAFEAARIAATGAAAMGLLFVLIPRQLLALFGMTEPTAVELGVQLLRYLSVSGVFVAVALTYTGGLQGTGDTRSPLYISCLLYTSPSPRDRTRSRMPSSA